MIGFVLVSGMFAIMCATVGACAIIEETFAHCPKWMKKVNNFVETKIFKM